MRKLSIAILGLFLLICSGCSHNQGMMVAGKGFIIGGNGIQYFNGLALVDNSRENTGWKIVLNDDDAFGQDGNQAGAKSVKSVERTIGKQITGYLVDLGEADAEAVREYLKDK